MAGAEKPLESSSCSYNFSIAYVVKFFGPSASLVVENKPNKVRTRFFRFSAVSHVPARRAISPAANSLSLRALAGCYRWQLAAMPGCFMGESNGGCTAFCGGPVRPGSGQGPRPASTRPRQARRWLGNLCQR